MLKFDQGVFSLRGLYRGVFTSDEEPTTFFVVERRGKTPIRPFDEFLGPIARLGYQDKRG